MRRYKNGFLVLMCSCLTLAAFIMGYDTRVIGAANVFIHHSLRSYSDQDKQLVTSILTLGAAVGALLGGILSDRYGRKPAVLLTDLLFLGGTLIMASANAVSTLVVGRVVIGLGAGLTCTVVPVYLSQVSPTPFRGRTIAIYQLFMSLGSIAAYVLFYYLNREWRAGIAVAIIPALIQVIGVVFMPESPRWLLKYNRQQEAMLSFAKIYNLQNDDSVEELNFEIKEIKRALREEGRLSAFQQLKNLFSHYYKGVIIGNMLFVIQQFTGINIVIYYCPEIIMHAQFDLNDTGIARERKVLLYSLPVFLILFAFTLAMYFCIDKWGRRYLLLLSLPLMSLLMFLTAIAFYLIIFMHQAWAHWLALGSLLLHVGFFAIGVSATVDAVNVQIYPLSLRATGNSLAIIALWISMYLVQSQLLSAIKTDLGRILTFTFFGVTSLLGTLFVYFFLPETKGIPLPHMMRLFGHQNEDEEESHALLRENEESEESNEK